MIAFVDQVRSAETLTIEITQVSQPTYTGKTDGGNSGNLVFQTKYVVMAQALGGDKVYYRENDGAAAVYSSARNVMTAVLEFVTAGVL